MAALGFGLLVLLVVAEVALRILMPQWREFYSGWFMTEISVPGHSNVTVGVAGFDGYFSQNNGDFRSHMRINGFNLRNDEPVAAADGRLWVIGDSMSFGWGVQRDEMYSSRLAVELGVPTYNVAGPGSNVCGWQSLYARMPKDVRPSAVVVGLTVENRVGIFDCKAAAMDAKPPVPERMELGSLANPIMIKRWFTSHSALYNFFAVSLKRVGLGEALLTRLGVIVDPNALMTHGRDVTRGAEMVASTATELAKLRAMIPADVPFVVAVFPARYEIRDDNEFYSSLRTGMHAELAQRGIASIDLLADFKAAGWQPTHFAHDGHWSALGHKVAGAAISKWLVENKFVPPRSQ
ncbi:hypothetical protein A6A04_03680 [Paramagnetospirillum marisnigri]|uniref:AlgX/AlgJ SGNH hydrolase-like domain-containing protein n=1 Tax=Paramagnetospirillum marisnigri TaxID=1285242 RepID=A0A178MMB8_9PROT|nr:hypothetical protein A6A04_03680 [Paramagnetospirillum marisnigri]